MPPKIKRPGEAPRAPKRRAVWPLLLLVMVALAGALTLTLAVAPKNRAPAGEPVLEPPPGTSALLDGLKPGDTLGSYRVHVLRIIDGQLGIDLIQGEHVITVWVALKGSRPSVPPRETERYSIYYGFPPEARAGAEREMESILSEIERRLRSTEQSAAVPPGMTSDAPPPSPAP